IPNGDVAGGAARIIEMAAFQIADDADIVNRTIVARNLERGLVARRQGTAFREQRTEDNGAAFVRVAPDAKIMWEMVAQAIADLGPKPSRTASRSRTTFRVFGCRASFFRRHSS